MDEALTFADAIIQTELGADLRQIKKALDEMVQDVEDDIENLVGFSYWWETNGKTWAEQLRNTMIKHRHIGQEYQLSE